MMFSHRCVAQWARRDTSKGAYLATGVTSHCLDADPPVAMDRPADDCQFYKMVLPTTRKSLGRSQERVR